jgi:predicted dehydrogenase
MNGVDMNFAVIGLGKIGIMHTAMVRAVPGAKLAALIDRVPKLGQHVQSMMSDPPPLFTSVEDAMRQVRLQGVFICTPQFAHRSVAETCLQAGLDVFVEKPLAHTLEDARAMVETRKKYRDAVVSVGYMKSHEGLYQEVGRLLKEQVLGPLRRFEATCYLSQVLEPKTKGWIYTKQLSGGGMVINSTCHLLHALHSWFGPARSVRAQCKSLHSTEVEDEATAEIEYASISGQVHTSWSISGYQVETSSILIEGESGRLEVTKDRTLRLELDRPAGDHKEGTHTWPRISFESAAFNLSPAYGGEGYYREDADFVQACRDRRPTRVSWEEGLLVQAVIDAIYRSKGQHIELGNHERAA